MTENNRHDWTGPARSRALQRREPYEAKVSRTVLRGEGGRKAILLPDQILQLADFLGNSDNAVRWQVWTALLMYLLLRYAAFLSDWSHSFSRLFTSLRSSQWRK